MQQFRSSTMMMMMMGLLCVILSDLEKKNSNKISYLTCCCTPTVVSGPPLFHTLRISTTVFSAERVTSFPFSKFKESRPESSIHTSIKSYNDDYIL